jgi:hypothetical protein
VNDIPTPSRHVNLAQYRDDMALVPTSHSPSLLVGYLEAYLSGLEHWLGDWRIAINVSKSTPVLFVKTARRIKKPRPVQFLGEAVQWVETTRYLRLTPDTQLKWAAQTNEVGKAAAQRLGMLVLLLKGEAACPLEMVRCFTSSSSVL